MAKRKIFYAYMPKWQAWLGFAVIALIGLPLLYLALVSKEYTFALGIFVVFVLIALMVYVTTFKKVPMFILEER